MTKSARRLGILLSGRGSNFWAIHESVQQGMLDAEIGCVISDKESAAGLALARNADYDALYLSPQGWDREAYDRRVVGELRNRNIALVCLAGFMRIITPYFVREFRHRILNIHPSLLPSFPGLDAQKKALDYGVKVTGCTVHFVDEGVDSGPIIVQAAVAVLMGDTVESLSARILQQEHILYSQAIGYALDGRCRVEGRRVLIANEAETDLSKT
ncbi:MAG: phosphoribosylglycinamide formyltransferase [Acidobacteria bacterium]|nr:phosphoribosylglycinamide formyltransferase [Acidobacteriota bacterium]MBI3655963.1 phosphoribosylglycinamide formyltransferase [Acidobacteriota bacterium]